jgi:hypothetical protein
VKEQPTVDQKRKTLEESDKNKEKVPVKDADRGQLVKEMNDICSLANPATTTGAQDLENQWPT